MSTRIGMLTGGGDCPGQNGVIRAATLHARNTFGWEVMGIRNGFEGLFAEDYIEVNGTTVQQMLPILGSSSRANPFAYPVKLPDGRVEIHDVSAKCIANLARLDLHGLIVVGGDGTMSYAHKFIQRSATRIVGVPKTIDNDLEATDYTVGFQTAVEVVVTALERLAVTAESHERVVIVEVMGRTSGWIALTAGLAGGANVVLIPEIDYDPDRVVEAFRRRHGRGVSHSVVVIAEGAKSKDRGVAGGAAVAELIAQRSDYEVRNVVLGDTQRSGSPCAFDRELATRFGVKAVELIAEGKFGHVAAIENGAFVAKPIDKAIKKSRLVDPAGELVRIAKAVGIELGA